MSEQSKLYLVPTPIGNLGDITVRALEVLNNCDLVLAEDTRTTGKLFKHYDIKTQLRSYHIHNEHKILDLIVTNLLEGERKVALVSDAGTPGISDPGFLLVRECLKNNIRGRMSSRGNSLDTGTCKFRFPNGSFCVRRVSTS